MRYSGDSFIVFIKQLYLNIYFLILNKYYNNILISKSFIITLPSPIIEVCLMNKKPHYNIFKINYEKKSFLLPINISQSILKVKIIIGLIIGYIHRDFYLSTRSRYLNESRTVDLYDIHDKTITIVFCVKGVGDLLDNEVSATTQIHHVHRPFFLDNDGTPNT